MQCHDLQEQLSAYIDGMLDSSQVPQVEGHLAVCPGCRAEYDDLKAAILMLQELPEIAPPPGFHENLRQKLEFLPPPAAPRGKGLIARLLQGKWMAPLAAAAVISLTVGVTALWHDRYNGDMFNPVMQNKATDEGINRYDSLDGNTDSLSIDDQNTYSLKVEPRSGANPVKDSSVKDSSAEDSPAGSAPELPEISGGDIYSEQRSRTPDYQGSNRRTNGQRAGSGEDAAAGDESAQEEQQLMYGFSESAQIEQQFPDNSTSADEPFSLYMQDKASEDDIEMAPNAGKVEMGMAVAMLPVITEYSVELRGVDDDAPKVIGETVKKYGGYLTSEPQSAEKTLILRIPEVEVAPFLEDLEKLGETKYTTMDQDLSGDIGSTLEELQTLEAMEQTLIKELDPEEVDGDKDLSALRELIQLQRQVLQELNKNINYDLVIINIKAGPRD